MWKNRCGITYFGSVPKNEPARAGARCGQVGAVGEVVASDRKVTTRAPSLGIEGFATFNFKTESPMSENCISDTRRRMLEDMAVRRFGEKTKHDYIR